MDYLEKARRVFEIEIEAAQATALALDENFGRAVEALRQAAERRNKVVVVGVGKSGHIGEKIAATLTSTGAPAVVLNSLNALHGDLGVVSDGDVVLALSHSGETDELLNILPALARFDITLIGITGHADSFLAKNSRIHLRLRVEREACPLNLAPTSSTTAMLVLGDALAMVLLEARGFQKDDFARFHPGGKLGRTLLLKVSQIMRDLSRMAVIQPETLVREALHAMAGQRAGAAVVVDAEQRLLGIFTHGDFGRQFRQHPDLLESPVEPHMTLGPITIHPDKLAAEVLHVLENHRIDDLVVVDDDGRPVGVVDSQDLARFRLL